MEEVEAFIRAGKLYQDGYICISNRFHIVGRIDREDWLELMAKDRFMTLEEFVKLQFDFKEYYIRVLSKDTFTVDPQVYKLLKSQHNF